MTRLSRNIQGQYVVSWRPVTHRYGAYETPEHRMRLAVRRDRLASPRGALTYHTKCSCGRWSSGTDWVPKRIAVDRWEAHAALLADQQLALDL